MPADPPGLDPPAPLPGAGAPDGYYAVSLRDLLVARWPRVVVTPAIVAVNVAIFVAMVVQSRQIAFSTSTLVRWGGLFPQAVVEGDWWRLLSAMWLHGHPLHLILNLVFLWQLGAIVERMLGPVVFAIVYLLAGVLATAVSLQTIAGNGVSVGASGAIFGMVGVLLAVAVTSRRMPGLGRLMAALRTQLITVILINLAFGASVPGIDNGAHIGGLVAGLGLGWLVGRDSIVRTPPLHRTLVPIALTIAIATGSVLLAGRSGEGPVVAAERARFDAFNTPAEARFREALAAVRTPGSNPAAAADALERVVLPALREARRRGDLRVRQTGEALRASTARDGASSPRRAAYERAYYDAFEWATFLARYEDAWRLRLGGLREGDPVRVADGDFRAADAWRLFTTRWTRPES